MCHCVQNAIALRGVKGLYARGQSSYQYTRQTYVLNGKGHCRHEYKIDIQSHERMTMLANL
jgi:hypothetical protein